MASLRRWAARAVYRTERDLEGMTTRELGEQMASVDGTLRLGDMVGRLSAGEKAEVDLALRLLLGLL